MRRFVSQSSFLCCFLLSFWCRAADAAPSVPCASTAECQSQWGDASICQDGKCRNPFHVGGCLKQSQREEWQNRLRTCHSDEDPLKIDPQTGNNVCRPSSLDYTEVRLYAQNWESAMLESWILQIILGELMEVPVSIETGVFGLNADFYAADWSADFGTIGDWKALERSAEVGDCRKLPADKIDPNSGDYLSCAHVVTEVWTGNEQALRYLEDEGAIEAPSGLGAIGHQGLYVPRFTGLRDPTLLTYLGLRDEENRRKLAERFLRPTTWHEYCTQVSNTSCTTADDVAQRAPLTQTERDRMFVPHLYTGHFRKTDANDCDANPTTCTGHFSDYPCGWLSYARAQFFHLDIALRSDGQNAAGGYTYSQMIETWQAANATRSDVLMLWWTPQALYQSFLGTDFEFQRINLEPANQDCIENRVSREKRCNAQTSFDIHGTRVGACDDQPHPLNKVIGTSLERISQNPNRPSVLHSPAYDTIRNFRISDLQIGELFEYLFERQKGDVPFEVAARYATCDWVVDNLELVTSFIPRTHPRAVVVNDELYSSPMFYVGITMAALALLGTVVTMFATYQKKSKRVFRFAQVEFLYLLLAGLLLVSLGSGLSVLSPSDATCVSVVWLINLGYTLELVPLVVKVAAIQRLMAAAQHMRRIVLRRRNLFGTVAGISSSVACVLLFWSIYDPPREQSEYTLTGDETSDGQVLIEDTRFCSSDAEAWRFFSITWQICLLLVATVLAFETRKLREDMNETSALAMLIYSQFVFVMLRAVTYLVEDSLSSSAVVGFRSILYSTDVIAILAIYFLPKFMVSDDSTMSSVRGGAGGGGGGRSAGRSAGRNNNRAGGTGRHSFFSGARQSNVSTATQMGANEAEGAPTHPTILAKPPPVLPSPAQPEKALSDPAQESAAN